MAARTQRMVPFQGGVILYELERKRVKNLNLRIRRDGSVYVSASSRVPLGAIDSFVAQKGGFIQAAQARFAREQTLSAQLELPPKDQCLAQLTDLTARMLPLLEPYGVKMPAVKVRDMKSRWGSCAYTKGSITLNRRLALAPAACAEYVVLHELCHFVHPNHSKAFHGLMAALMPDYKQRKAALERWSA